MVSSYHDILHITDHAIHADSPHGKDDFYTDTNKQAFTGCKYNGATVGKSQAHDQSYVWV